MVVCNDCSKDTDTVFHKNGEADIRKYKIKDMVCFDCRLHIYRCYNIGIKLMSDKYKSLSWIEDNV